MGDVKNLQVQLQINRKISKSNVEARFLELEKLIRTKLCSARNWKPVVTEAEDEVTGLFEKMIIGTCEIKDGEKIESLSDFTATHANVHVYKLNTDGPLAQNIDQEEDENIIASQLWQLPCLEFDSLWENLIYDSDLKNELMSYVYALMRLSEKHVNTTIINVNRLILLTGPPGTGKTSLCKGLAHILSIRLNDRYSRSVMVEINSHSLFSKWFSESGKLVQKMFDQIHDLADDETCLVFVLIDEVESLGMCRESSSARSEPADSIRAVNALLTQIDRIRRRDNVLILCTSNLKTSLDRAFIDRADLIKDVGEPTDLALYAMLKACILELIRIGVVTHDSADDQIFQDINDIESELNHHSSELLKVAKNARGLSGRAISMLPTVVYSKSLEETFSLDTCIKLFDEAICERKIRIA